ncbi:hypothetical protein MRX96_050072 [Rhipicephalus microplus]
MKKRDTTDTSLSTSSYETALTSTSKQRGARAPDKEAAKDEDSSGVSRLPPTTTPNADQVAKCPPAVKVPSDEWLPRRLSQLGIPYIPRDGAKSKPTSGTSGVASGDRSAESDSELSSDPAESSRRSDNKTRRPPGKEFSSKSEGPTSASATRRREEKNATSRWDSEYDRDAARSQPVTNVKRLILIQPDRRSEPERRSPQGPEFLVQTALQAGATSPFSVHSATSDEKRPHEESEKRDEAEPKVQHGTAAVASSVARTTGSKDQRPPRADDRFNRPKAKRQAFDFFGLKTLA